MNKKYCAATYGILLLFGALFFGGVLVPVRANAEADKAGGQTARLEKKLKEIIIPSIRFQNLSLNEVLAYLQRQSVELDADEGDPTKKGVNFTLNLGESGNADGIRINLKLSNVPLITALKYTAALSQLSYRVEPDAVVLYPLEKPVPSPGRKASASAAKVKIVRTEFVPSADQIKQISSEEFLESGHRIGSNPPQINIKIKPDSMIDAGLYGLESGPGNYLQVKYKNVAMKPRKILAAGSTGTGQSKILRHISILFPNIQERDDFAAELKLGVSASSGSRNTPTFENTTKINSYDIKPSGHRIHDDQILDLLIKSSSALTKDSIKTPQQNRPRWVEVTHVNNPLKPRPLFGFGRDENNKLYNVMIKFPTMRELDDFVMRLGIKVNKPLHVKDTSPSPQNTVRISSEEFQIDGHRTHDDRILDIKIKSGSGLDLNLRAMKNMRRWLEVMHENELMTPLRICGSRYKSNTTELESLMIEFQSEKELDDFVKQLGLKLRVK